MQRSDWVIRTRTRPGTLAVHYGTQQEIERIARTARDRGDDIEEKRMLTAPEGKSGKERGIDRG